MNRRYKYVLMALLALSVSGKAQQVRTVTLASPFAFRLQPKPGTPAPVVGDTLGSFEILRVTPAAGGFEVMLVAYDTGSFSFDAGGGITQFHVLAPPPESIKQYGAPKEPVFERPKPEPDYLLPLIATVIAAAVVLFLLLRKRKKPSPVVFAVQTPGGLGLLQEVKEAWVGGRLNSLQLGEGLINSLQAQFGMPVKKSTLQLIREIRNRYPQSLNTQLEQVLKNTDGWRFGKQSASAPEGESAIRILEHLFQFTNQKAKQEA